MNRLRSAILVSLLLISGGAFAKGVNHIDVPAGDLADALRSLAQQAGVELIYRTEQIKGLKTAGVRGELAAEEAVRKLIAGTALTVRMDESGAISVVPRDSTAGNAVTSAGNSGIKMARAEGDADEGAANGRAGDGQREGDIKLEEVVVTAQKRKERLQDVPASIAVLNGEQLEKMMPQSLQDFAGYAPGLTTTSPGGIPGQVQMTLRGISSGSDGLGALVGTYVGDVPVGTSTPAAQGSNFTMDLMPYDVDRIEVLSGPQGTLYGAGAMGGLLKYVLQDAKLSQFELRTGATVNSIDHSSGLGSGARAVVNIPLIQDQLAIRVSGFEQKTQGFIDNVGENKRDWNPYKQEGARVAAFWQPTSALSVKVYALFQNIDADASAGITVDPVTFEPLKGPFTADTGRLGISDPGFTQKSRLYSAVLNWDLGSASLTSVSGWQTFTNHGIFEAYQLSDLVDTFPGGPFPGNHEPNPSSFDEKGKYTQEVRLTSAAAQRLQWMLGAFYTKERSLDYQALYALDSAGNGIPSANPFVYFYYPLTYKEVAIFANGTVKFGEHFDVSAGVRYAENRQNGDAVVYGYFVNGALTPPDQPIDIHSKQGVSTWMVSPQWHLNRDTMVYARVATGYRPGGYSFALHPDIPQTLGADTLISYEMGFKSLLGNHLSVEAALYDVQWKDVQINLIDPILGFNFFGNGTTAASRGGEAAVDYSWSNGLRMGATLSVIDAKLTADAPSIGGVDGMRLPLSSRMSGSLRIDYQRNLMNNYSLSTGLGYRYASDYWNALPAAFYSTRIRNSRPVDFYLGIANPRIEARLFLRNTFSSQPKILELPNPGFTTPALCAAQPRTVGLSIDVKF